MSFRTVYAVADAWHAARWVSDLEWRLLMHLARQTDDKTLTVIRSQARLGDELGVSGRHVRTLLKAWRDRGVVRIVEHGGGSDRKPAKYAIDLGALKVLELRLAERRAAEAATAERKDFRCSATATPCGSPSSSAVDDSTAEPQAVPQLECSSRTSTVEAQQRNSGDATAEVAASNSGSVGVPPLHRIKESKSEEVTAPPADSASQANSLAMAKGALASSPRCKVKRPSEADIRHKVEQLASLKYSPEQIALQLKNQSVYIADVRRYYPQHSRGAPA